MYKTHYINCKNIILQLLKGVVEEDKDKEGVEVEVKVKVKEKAQEDQVLLIKQKKILIISLDNSKNKVN